MMPNQDPGDWTLISASQQEIDTVCKKCRHLVVRRAAISAGMSAVPIPGIDIAVDISLLISLIEDINAEFGLTSEQINRLRPELQLIAYQVMIGMGSVLVGKLVTREIIAQLLKRTSMKSLIKYTAKIVPVAGQIASATVGFFAFRTIGYQHIEACAQVAGELLVLQAKPVH